MGCNCCGSEYQKHNIEGRYLIQTNSKVILVTDKKRQIDNILLYSRPECSAPYEYAFDLEHNGMLLLEKNATYKAVELRGFKDFAFNLHNIEHKVFGNDNALCGCVGSVLNTSTFELNSSGDPVYSFNANFEENTNSQFLVYDFQLRSTRYNVDLISAKGYFEIPAGETSFSHQFDLTTGDARMNNDIKECLISYNVYMSCARPEDHGRNDLEKYATIGLQDIYDHVAGSHGNLHEADMFDNLLLSFDDGEFVPYSSIDQTAYNTPDFIPVKVGTKIRVKWVKEIENQINPGAPNLYYTLGFILHHELDQFSPEWNRGVYIEETERIIDEQKYHYLYGQYEPAFRLLIMDVVGQGTAETPKRYFNRVNDSFVQGVATPAEGWRFVGWYNTSQTQLLSTDLSYQKSIATMASQNMWFEMVVAVFEEIQQEYTISFNPSQDETYTDLTATSPYGENEVVNCRIEFPHFFIISAFVVNGSTVSATDSAALAAVGIENFAFDIENYQATFDYRFGASDAVVGVNWVRAYYLVTQSSVGGYGTGNGGNGGYYFEGYGVTMEANSSEGYEFVNWTVDGVEVSDQANFTFNMPAEDTVIQANFQAVAPANTVENYDVGADDINSSGYDQYWSYSVTVDQPVLEDTSFSWTAEEWIDGVFNRNLTFSGYIRAGERTYFSSDYGDSISMQGADGIKVFTLENISSITIDW